MTKIIKCIEMTEMINNIKKFNYDLINIHRIKLDLNWFYIEFFLNSKLI